MSAKCCFVACAAAAALLLGEEERRKRPRYWVHTIIANREQHSQLWVMYNDLCMNENNFLHCHRAP